MNSLASHSRSDTRSGAVARAVAVALVANGSVCTLAQAADAPPSTGVQAGPVTLQFGGFTALESVYRSKNETADIGSNFNTSIPFPYQTNDHITEFRESARQSRFSLLAKGPSGDGWNAEAYFETDFLSAGVTSNSNESNSYTLRMRHFYGILSNTDGGWYLLGGQDWSLATLYGKGLTPRTEVTPATIDAQYATGFNWTRNPQLRLVKNFNDVAALGVSLESPQAQFTHPGTALVNNAGGSLLTSTSTYAIDFVPDLIIKAAIDPGYGHYEVYGLGRGFRDRYPAAAAGTNNTAWGGGVGAGVILPLGSQLTFQLSGLAGDGIGRYGTSSLPDVTVKPDGTVATIGEVDALAGLTYKPVPTLSIYVYGGVEEARRTGYVNAASTTGYGYGSELYNNSGCDSLTGTATTCVADSRRIEQLNVGEWWKAYQGSIGNFQIGLQYSYTKRETFSGIGGAPSTNISMGFVSFRYYPYQR